MGEEPLDDAWVPDEGLGPRTRLGPPSLEAPGWARRLGFAALVTTPAAAVLLARAGYGLWDAAWIAILLVALPLLSIAQVPLAEAEPIQRVPVYLGSSAFLLVLAAVSFQVGSMGVGVSAMGLDWPPAGTFVVWVMILVAAAGLIVLVFDRIGAALNIPETSILAELLPRTEEERSAFAGLSVAAGLGEELAYRGYAITALAPLLGSGWWAALVSSSVFGCLHAYQGVMGIVRTGVLGFVLAASFLLTGSLWPAIMGHAIMDLLGGLVLGGRLLRRGPERPLRPPG